jgi:hypothetical protein
MKTTLNIGIEQNGELTYVAQLGNNERRELFFRILWKEIEPSYFYDGTTKTEKEIKNFGHITFHQDGLIQLTIKHGKGKKDEKIVHSQLIHTISTLPPDGYGVLLIYSIYDFALFRTHIGKPKPLRFRKKITNIELQNVSIHLEAENTNRFSFVIFLLGKTVDAKIMLNSKFPSLFDVARPVCLEDYFIVDPEDPLRDIQLLIAFTKKVIVPPYPNLLVGYSKAMQIGRIEPLSGFALACGDEKLHRLS